jgi:acyl-CoA synthetase (NDP forming)
MTQRRPVYSHAALRRLIDPSSVAILGLSRKPGSPGARAAANLGRFAGRVMGVNPGVDEAHGIACFPSIGALPETPDCAILAVPADAVVALAEQCAAAGIGGCVIFSSGFAETGLEDGIALQHRLAAIARASGLRIAGPNCYGLINNVTGAGMSFTSGYAEAPPRAGGVAIVSQSGGLGWSVAQAGRRGGAWSHYVAAGNSCDVDVCDYAAYLADDPSCAAIALIAEGLQDGERLIEAGERARAAGKPIVMYKAATGAASAQAALSHTGTLAGANEAYEAAWRRLGIIAVDAIEDVYETAAFFAKAGRPRATGVAAIAASGGACVITLDKAEAHGVAMPLPAAGTRAALETIVPDFGNPTNPCDMTAMVATDAEAYAACVGALLADPAYGALVAMVPSVGQATPGNVAMFSRLAAAAGKPVCLAWLSEWKEGPGAVEAEAAPLVARFRSTDRAFAALAAWHAREAALSGPPPRPRGGIADPAAAAKAGALLDAAGPTLSERESKAIIASYGVAVAEDRVAKDVEEAVAAGEAIGYPVVLKAESADIAHKSEAGVVKLDLGDAAAIRDAFAQITAAAARIEPAPKLAGMLVQPMVPAGIEMVIGGRVDPTFGPMVVVGFGGVLVELLRDSTAELAPVSQVQALAMLARLRGAPLLDGFRGAAAADREGLAAAIVAVSELIADQSGRIAEIDVNPLICASGRTIAVDALVVRPASDRQGAPSWPNG